MEVQRPVGRLDRLVRVSRDETSGGNAEQKRHQALADTAGRAGRVVEWSAREIGAELVPSGGVTEERHVVAISAGVDAELECVRRQLLREVAEQRVNVVVECVVALIAERFEP